jgi:hypothetical protein
MDMAAMTSALAASPRAHLLSASYSPLRASAPQAGAAASGEASHKEGDNSHAESHLKCTENLGEPLLNQTESVNPLLHRMKLEAGCAVHQVEQAPLFLLCLDTGVVAS